MPKERCTARAEWQFELGRAPKRLSPHYQLDCDHGTPIMVCREQGGAEPVYLCEQHAEEEKRHGERPVEARTVSAASPSDSESASSSAIPKTEESPAAASANPAVSNPNEASPAQNPPLPESAGEVPIVQAVQAKADEAAVAKPIDTTSEIPAQSPPLADPKTPETSTAKQNRELQTKDAPHPQPPSLRTAEVALPPAKPVRLSKELSARLPARDLTFGNPSKAIVDEAIWNLTTGDAEAFRSAIQRGKSLADAAQAAGGQLAAIHRKIAEYSSKLDAILSASAKTISVQDTIDKPLEQATIEIIESDSMTDQEKDTAIQQLGTLQEWAKLGLHAQFTPIEANRGLLAIGDRMNWGGATEISEQLRPAYRGLFASLRKAIHAAAPGAQEIQERLINLHAAKSSLLASATPTPAPELLPR